MIRLVAIAAFVFVAGSTFAQISNIPGVGNTVLKVNKKYADVEGSPYLYDEWRSGQVVDKGGKIFTNVLIKFDAYKDCIEINQDGAVMILDNAQYPKFNLQFAQGTSNSVVHHDFRTGFAIPGGSKNTYVEILEEGKASLLKRLQVDYLDENVSSYGGTANIKEFRRKEKYFIVNPAGEVVEFKFSKRALLAAVGEKQSELEAFMEANKLKVKNPEEAKLVLAYFNSI